MNSFLRPAFALLLGASATLLTACDYKYSPGVNTQFEHGFNGTPTYSNIDINRDSINNKQEVHTPVGVGSATAIKNGTTDDQLNSAPAGKSRASTQSASGKMAPVDQAQPATNAPKSAQ